MPPKQPQPFTEGSSSFDSDAFFSAWNEECLPQNNDLRTCIIKSFNLPANDAYVYHAMGSATLAQVQKAIQFGGQGGLHAWYRDDEGKELPLPPAADITAYTSLFSSKSAFPAALRAFTSNAKKASLRARTAEHLQAHLQLPTAPLALPNKLKQAHKNPYYDIWAWSCQCLEWGGPVPETERTNVAHHTLLIFYHHFGCICPSYDAVRLIAQLAGCSETSRGAKGKLQKSELKPIIDLGSGNGYWTYILRREGLTVHAVDNGLSAWRTMWIADTIKADGISYLKSHKAGRDAILLLVYPQVSGDFTGKVLGAYEGDTVVVAGTQNKNGYTGFKSETIAEWMSREKPEFEKVCQIPLPSFAGKDEALYVFQKKAAEVMGVGN